MLKMGVVGYGYWGPNIVRNFMEASESQVLMVCDEKNTQLEKVKTRYPTIITTSNYEDLLSSEIDAIAVVTPVSTHFDLALKALQAGKHIFVEKPFTKTSDQAKILIEEAEKRNLLIHVDHTFIYTGAVRKIKEFVTDGTLGEIYYYDSTRINLGLFQHDVNVLWDLAVHDLAIMDFIIPDKARAVSATGISHLNGEPQNTAFLTVFFEKNIIAHINVNWLSPVKMRSTLIGGSKKMIVYDDLKPSDKIMVYDKGLITEDDESIYQMLIGYRIGDIWVPKLDLTEALNTEVLRILEAASESMLKQGQKVEL